MHHDSNHVRHLDCCSLHFWLALLGLRIEDSAEQISPNQKQVCPEYEQEIPNPKQVCPEYEQAIPDQKTN